MVIPQSVRKYWSAFVAQTGNVDEERFYEEFKVVYKGQTTSAA